MWKLFSRYQQLELTEHEAVVAAALCIMNAGKNRVARINYHSWRYSAKHFDEHKRGLKHDNTVNHKAIVNNDSNVFKFSIPDATLSPVATPIVSGSVDYLLEILDYSIKRNHDTNSHTMCKLMTLISDMRSLRKYFDEFSHNFLSDGLDIGVPQIVKDLFMSRLKPS